MSKKTEKPESKDFSIMLGSPRSFSQKEMEAWRDDLIEKKDEKLIKELVREMLKKHGKTPTQMLHLFCAAVCQLRSEPVGSRAGACALDDVHQWMSLTERNGEEGLGIRPSVRHRFMWLIGVRYKAKGVKS